MNTFYDKEFFSQHERGKTPREQVGDLVRRYASITVKPYSLVWRKVYLAFEEETGVRPSEKKKLDAIEKAGLMGRLLEIAKRVLDTGTDHTNELNTSIPEFTPHESIERRFVPTKHDPIEVIPYRSPHTHRAVAQKADTEVATTPMCSHEWGVFSTALLDVSLLVQCVECGAYGTVRNPTADVCLLVGCVQCGACGKVLSVDDQ